MKPGFHFWIPLLITFSLLPMPKGLQAADTSPITETNRPTSPHRLEARLGVYKGWNVFWIDGKPVPPFMYSGTEQGRKTWVDPTRKSIQEFSNEGYDIIQTDLWFKYSLRPDGTFDLAGIRRQLAGILDINPQAKLVVRINVSAPKWWLQQNPEERCQVTKSGAGPAIFSGDTAESLASEKYQAFAMRYLKQFLTELEQTPEADRIIGFHIGGGVYGEWHYYGIKEEPDASQSMRQVFQSEAIKKYQTLECINAAWGTNFASLAEITVPNYERRYEITDGDFRDPVRDRYVIDYYECQRKTVSGLVNGLAKLTKETWSRPVITGVFYGYLYGGWTVGSQASQSDIETMFLSPYIDYFSGPFGSRNMKGSGLFRSLAASCALHGKVWISENDACTHLGIEGKGAAVFPDVPQDEHQSIARMRRNSMYCFTENAGQWWYDFGPASQGGGWWSSPGMLKESGDLLKLSNRLMENPFKKPSDVLVVLDMKSFDHVRPAQVDRLTFKLTEDLSDTLLGTGVCFDKIFLMDLKLVDFSKYKMVIFGNVFSLSEADKAIIKEKVIADGRSVLFMSGAGYSDGRKNDAALIGGLTGINVLKSTLNAPKLNVTIRNNASTLTANGVSSVFAVQDPNAKTLGTFENGQVGAASKEVHGGQVYYFGIPLGRQLSVYKALFEEAGIRSFADNTVEGDYVSVGGGIIGIYSVKGGEKVIKPLNGTTVHVLMEPFSTLYFEMTDGKALNNDPAAR
jgi:hypothetical protein